MSDSQLDKPAAAAEPGAPPMVSPTEHLIITMARILVGGTTTTELTRLLTIAHPMPARVSPMCADLVEDALCQVWSTLALRGGARPAQHLGTAPTAAGSVVEGRVWQRHRPVPLAFTPATLAILRWLVGTPLAIQPTRGALGAMPARGAELPAMPLDLGDQLVVYLALDALAPYPAAALAFAAQPLVRAAPLAWLAVPALLAMAGTAEVPRFEAFVAEVPRFEALVAAPGVAIVEALAPALARRWSEAELAKRAATRPEAVIAVGAAQDAVLVGFLEACHAARRRDLAGWVLDAVVPLLANDLSPAPLQLDPATPLGQRAMARVAAGSLLRAVGHWAAWDQEHRGVRFFDEDYAVAQFLLARFEVVGPLGAARVAHWLHELGSLGMLDAT